MITLSNVDIGYTTGKKTTKVFSNLSLQFKQGEFIGLLGDNGIGKSTLLKTITGQLKCLAGTLVFNGKDIHSYSSAQLSHLLSIVITEKIGGFNLTVFDVVASGRTPYINVFGKLLMPDITIINAVLKSLNIETLKDKLIDELSDGQRQKVMIAKSLAQQTPVIILDEPTAFLDYNSKHFLFQTLKILCEKENKLIIVSSHDLELMQQYTSRSITLLPENNIEIASR